MCHERRFVAILRGDLYFEVPHEEIQRCLVPGPGQHRPDFIDALKRKRVLLGLCFMSDVAVVDAHTL